MVGQHCLTDSFASSGLREGKTLSACAASWYCFYDFLRGGSTLLGIIAPFLNIMALS